MSQEDIYINGDLLRLRREAGGWAINDMATRACLSVKQVRQLEDGGMSSFYSQSVKATAAKKVGAILGLSPEQVFAETVEPSQEPEAIETEIVHHAEDKDPVVIKAALAPATLPEAVEAQVEAPVHVVKKPAPAPAPAPAPSAEEPKSKSSLWLIAGLFAAALAVAAYMQPREEPASEPAPPLQVVPSEDPASAASAADVSASAPVEGASMAAVEASSPRPAASVAAPISARSVSTSTAASAPAAAASKAP